MELWSPSLKCKHLYLLSYLIGFHSAILILYLSLSLSVQGLLKSGTSTELEKQEIDRGILPAKVKEKTGSIWGKPSESREAKICERMEERRWHGSVDKVLDAPQLEPGLGFLGPVHKACACKHGDRRSETGGFTNQQWQSQSPCSVKDHNSK